MPRPRIGFVLPSKRSAPLPSTRISVLNMLPYLHAAGYVAEIAFEPPADSNTPDLDALDAAELAARYDVVYLQKVYGDSALRLVERLERRGVRTVFGLCDARVPEMVAATSATAVVTDYLRSLYPEALRARMHVVPDGIERPEVRRREPRELRGAATRRLRAVLVTSSAPLRVPVIGRPPPWLTIAIVGAYPAKRWQPSALRWTHWQIDSLHPEDRVGAATSLVDGRIKHVTWTPERVYEELERADIAIIPVEPEQDGLWLVKSENRLTLKMSAALPVVTSPVPSYEPVVDHGRNAFFARTRSEWLECLERLRDPQLRREMGEAARATVLPRFSMESQAAALIGMLQLLVGG